jgi:SAM-dependent methyltransferase
VSRGPVHAAAERGYGAAAEMYARARPAYPADAVDWLVEAIGIGGETEVAEIGAGTGKFTTELVARGVPVVAVEPVAAMRERLAALGPTVRVVDAVAESLPFSDGTVSAVVASQSLHWFDVDRALAEFDRVLVPDGSIGLVWNFRDVDVSWQCELDELLSSLRGRDVPHSRDGRWERAVVSSRFEIAAARSWRWSFTTDLEGALDRVRSVSYVASLPDDERHEVDELVRGLVSRHRVDAASIEWSYVTEAYVLRRPQGKEYAAAL